jgi:hypothetical protein
VTVEGTLFDIIFLVVWNIDETMTKTVTHSPWVVGNVR